MLGALSNIMANPEHLAILAQGVEAWNEWRDDNPQVEPDLSRADLNRIEVARVNLVSANLRGANLRGADLSRAKLKGAYLNDADLSLADLSHVRMTQANLNRAYLRGAHLNRADLSHAKISEARLNYAYLGDADLRDADMRSADLNRAYLNNANLSGAYLGDADLSRVDLGWADLTRTHLTKATIGWTVFANNDLSSVIGLERVHHKGPSTIGIDTIFRSDGNIPESFLRGAGVPDNFITYARSLVGSAVNFYSCFISYSTKDEEFARRLYSRMRDDHLRVWFAPEDIKAGLKIHEQLEQAIQMHDRLLVVLSENSLQSEWVMTEIRNARQVELRENRRKLFPIRLVDFDAIRKWKCFDADSGKDLAIEVREYFIPDFSNWKDHDSFEKAVIRLLRDLNAYEERA
jgi:uncharacterized protein YjbI with pentapeptide repeats